MELEQRAVEVAVFIGRAGRVCTKCGKEKRPHEFSLSHAAKSAVTLKAQCKECVAARAREWNARNQDRRREYGTEYYAKNKDRLDAAALRWQANNPEKVAVSRREAQRRWRARHRGRLYRPELLYPYSVSPAADGAELILRINELVSKSLPESVRADACQELALRVLSGEADAARLEEYVRECVRTQYRFLPSKFHVSLDCEEHKASRIHFLAARLAQAWGVA